MFNITENRIPNFPAVSFLVLEIMTFILYNGQTSQRTSMH